MEGWQGLGGTNYAPSELEMMDCEVFEIRQGDTLYLPRSFVHVAESSGNEPSIHMTFGLQESGRRWKDLLLHALSTAECGDRCDEDLMTYLIDSVNDLQRAPYLGFRLQQAFPLWKCYNNPDASGCSQEFAVFEDRIHEFSAFIFGKREKIFSGYDLLALRSQLGRVATRKAFRQGIISLIDSVNDGLANSRHVELTPASSRKEELALAFLQSAWAQDRKSRRTVLFSLIDRDCNGIISRIEFAAFASKLGFDLVEGTENLVFAHESMNVTGVNFQAFLDLGPMYYWITKSMQVKPRLASARFLFPWRGFDQLGFSKPSFLSDRSERGRRLLATSMEQAGASVIRSSCDESCEWTSCDGSEGANQCSSCDASCDIWTFWGGEDCDESCDGQCTIGCDEIVPDSCEQSCDEWSCHPGHYRDGTGCSPCLAGSYFLGGDVCVCVCVYVSSL